LRYSTSLRNTWAGATGQLSLGSALPPASSTASTNGIRAFTARPSVVVGVTIGSLYSTAACTASSLGGLLSLFLSIIQSRAAASRRNQEEAKANRKTGAKSHQNPEKKATIRWQKRGGW